MPTKNVKHTMLKEAKRMANTEFKEITKVIILNGREGEWVFPKEYTKNLEIENILNDHPEFDPNTFRQMIKEIEIRNKQKEK